MVKLTWLHDDPSKNYLIRMCMLVADAHMHSSTSVIQQCAECDRDIWVDLAQALPTPPEGVVIDGEVRLCMECTAVHGALDDEPLQWLGPA